MGLSHSPRIVTDGLVGYWDANNTKSYSGSGTAINDLSGNNNHGTLVGSPPVSNGAITLNGSSQFISTNYTQTSVTAYTIDAWFNTTSGDTGTFVQNRGSGAGQSISVGINNGAAGKLYIQVDSDIIGIGQETIASTYIDGNWHNVIGVFNQPSGAITPSSFTIYVDGIQAATSEFTYGSISVPLTGLSGTIIGYHQAWDVYYSGSLGPIKIYNRALSATEAKQNFNALKGRFGI